MKHFRAIMIAAFVCALGLSIEADRFAGAIHRGTRMMAASGTAHPIGTLRPRFASHGLSYRSSPSAGPVAAPLSHLLSSAPFLFNAADAARSTGASSPSSARAPPAL